MNLKIYIINLLDFSISNKTQMALRFAYVVSHLATVIHVIYNNGNTFGKAFTVNGSHCDINLLFQETKNVNWLSKSRNLRKNKNLQDILHIIISRFDVDSFFFNQN